MEIMNNVSLRKYNTFGLEVKAEFFAVVHEPHQIQEILNQKLVQSLPLMILGGGSNILFTKDFEGLVLKISIPGIRYNLLGDHSILVTAGAGENWDSVVQYCVSRNWGGLENLSMIPGSVGASPIQNIGAYGVEVRDVFSHLDAIDLKTFEKKRFNLPDCHFGYRNSVFKNDFKDRYLIISVSFLVSSTAKPNLTYPALRQELKDTGTEISIKSVADAVMRIRRSKLPDPSKTGNAGSFFKNPVVTIDKFESLRDRFPGLLSFPSDRGFVKVPAAWLIEQCGWKGRRIGNAGVHFNQPLVLVNYGCSSGKEILVLAHSIKESVLKRFDIPLEMEVNIM